MNDRSTAYRCKVTAPDSAAWIKFGSSQKSVEVVEQSRDSFTVRLKEKLAQKIAIGKEVRLIYQDMLWAVVCRNKWMSSEGVIDIEFESVQELRSPTITKAPLFSGSNASSRVNPLDGTLALIFLVIITLCILIMPAWGGKWGTSDLICNAVVSVWKAALMLLTGREYL